MKKSTLLLVFLLGIVIFTVNDVTAKCCPPPPTTTGSGRTLPHQSRTNPPSSSITLPPTTDITTPSITPPLNTTIGPVTASQEASATRTTANFSGFRTSGMTNRPTTNQSSQNNSNTPTPSANRSNSVSNPVQSTVAPKLSQTGDLLPGTTDFIVTEEFEWEDWWDQTTGYLLSTYKSKDEAYASVLKEEDIPRLLPLLRYRGIFEEGIREMAVMGLKGLGDSAVDVLVQIINGKFKFKSGQKASFLNKNEYEEVAVIALGYIGSKKAKDAIAGLLIREWEFESLDVPVADKSEEILQKTLKDKTWQNRFWACLSLGRIGDSSYIPILKNVLSTDKSKYVRAAAAEAIALIGGSKSIPVLSDALGELKSYYQAKAFVAASLGFVGAADPMEDIHAAIQSKNGDVRVAGAWALVKVIARRITSDKEYSDLLTEYATVLKRENDDTVRRSMALAWAFICIPEVLQELKPFLQDARDPGVQAIAALAAGFSGSPKAVGMLASLPVSDEPLVEAARGYAISLLTSSAKARIAVTLMENENDILKAFGVLKASELKGDKKLLNDVYKLRLYKGDDIVKRAASYSIIVFFADGLSKARKCAGSKSDAMRATSYIAYGVRNDSEALAELERYSRIKDRELKKCVNIGISLMGGLPLITSMGEALKDGKEVVRSAAVVALGSLGRPETLDKILDIAQNDKNFKVRAYALASLANINIPASKHDEIIKILSALIKDNKQRPMVKAYAAFTLSLFPESRSAYEACRAAVSAKHSDVQAMAAISLGMFGNPSAARDIKTLIAKSRGTPLAYAGYIGLGMIGEKTLVPDIVTNFEFGNSPEEMLAMAFAIAKNAGKETHVMLYDYLENEDVYLREFTVKCLGMIENLPEDARGETIEKLKKLEGDSDMQIQFYAAVVRFAMGDRKALIEVLDVIHDKQYYPEGEKEANWVSLMGIINDSMPKNRCLKSYIWGDDE